MSLPSIYDLNVTGYQLLQLIETRPVKVIPIENRQNMSQPLPGVGKAFDLTPYLDEKSGLTEYRVDGWDNITAVSRTKDGKVIELKEENYPLLKNAASFFLEQNDRFLIADNKFVEEAIFDWLTEAMLQQRVAFNLTTFLERHIEHATKRHTFYFKVSPLGIESSIKFAGVSIFHFSDEHLRKEYEKLKDGKRHDWATYKSLFRDATDFIAVGVEVKAVESMAEYVARTRAQQAINALKCFLFKEAISKEIYLFNLEFKALPHDSTTILSRTEDGGIRIHSLNMRLGGPVELTNAHMQRLNRIGLHLFDGFLTNFRMTPFNQLIGRGIDQLADAFSIRDLHARCVDLVSFFELFLNYDEKSGAKPQTYMVRNILPKLFENQDLTNEKRQIQLLYHIRNRYLHNRHKISFEIKDLYELQMLAFCFLRHMVILSKTLQTKEDFFKHFGIPI
ncbi:hypothetical protein DJ568_16760 [Mucilaginibacter hurinus]|uniref:ApeA N-terminal domain-containing protein n=1 Tax=Mucilaginibacter hurinus TaxID=2201324 RepID=A0A367GLF9_9SPHI|nr:hypothetical protein [Mucilaginibacter hurinus]RCH53686.1 hypothetical protein DJ568_16760 [Mucilaginibacter hurinus]